MISMEPWLSMRHLDIVLVLFKDCYVLGWRDVTLKGQGLFANTITTLSNTQPPPLFFPVLDQILEKKFCRFFMYIQDKMG